jgi:uncharacterized protein
MKTGKRVPERLQKAIIMSFFLTLAASSAECTNGKDNSKKKVSSADVAKIESIPPRKLNGLGKEKSPYLLQHADNPVNWLPWGEEAFARAKKEDKPVFLSIGYSTCHWCHVMAHESFEDEKVAAQLNDSFISIKVDREERPDIDHIYMTVCQLMTGSGGWPLTIVMTPDKKPFYAATYIPRESRFGRVGMLSLLPAITSKWEFERKELLGSSDRVLSALKKASGTSSGETPGEEALHLGFNQLARRFDHENAGFGRGNKFPTPHQIVFLLRYWKRTGNEGALEMATRTLGAMRRGGIYDHVGYGFHRYSTDSKWLVPHFEKMLYDQALLLWAYVEAFQATKKPLYKKTAREIAEYVLRDMTSSDGAFFSAEDADSEGEEGRFYLWTAAEIEQLLDEETSALFIARFGVEQKGNFRDEGSKKHPGRNILHENVSLDETSARFGLSVDEVEVRLDRARKTLLDARGKRVRPLLDDKVLTDWNGLMIGAMAMAGRALDEPKYIEAAQKAVSFIQNKLRLDNGRLLHRFRDGESGLPAHLDDYAFYTFGLIELYEATFEVRHMKEAIRLAGVMNDLFADKKGGGFFLSASDSETILVRPKELYDGAIPSGASLAFYNLARLSRITGESRFEEEAASIASAFGGDVGEAASSHTSFLAALDFAIGPSVEIVIAGEKESPDTKEMIKSLKSVYAPNKVVLFRSTKNASKLASIAPFTAGQSMLNGRATAYVCVKQSCSFPTGDIEKMLSHLTKKLDPGEIEK